MPNYLGPADHLIYEGQVIPRGEMVHATARELERLKSLGHQFEGHIDNSGGPVFVDQPRPATVPIGSDGSTITQAEIVASSSEYHQALHDAALKEEDAKSEKAEGKQAAAHKS